MPIFDRLYRWFRKRFTPGAQPAIFSFADAYRSQKAPGDLDLIGAYRDAAYFCANLNVNGVVNCKLRLYAKTAAGQPRPRCPTRPIGRKQLRELSAVESIRKNLESADRIDEVIEHPLLDLLKYPNEHHSQADLIGHIQLYQELTGRAYVLIEDDERFDLPAALWVLPSQSVTPQRLPGSPNVVDHYWYYSSAGRQILPTEAVLAFRTPDPRDPYGGGYAPAQAAWERISVSGKYLSQTQATLDNRARPDAIVSSADPEYTIGPDERKRLEGFLNQKFRGAGSGQVYVSSHGLKLDPLNWSPKDLGELADNTLAIEQIARAFDIPLALLERDANRANAEASRNQHAEMAIRPRLRRIEGVLNRFLLPRYSDRLFCCFDDPVKEDVEQRLKVRESNLRLGLTTINEERAEDGYLPVAWGEEPWLAETLRQPSAPDAGADSSETNAPGTWMNAQKGIAN